MIQIGESSNNTDRSCSFRRLSKEELLEVMLRIKEQNPDWKPTWEAAPPPRKENPGWENIRRINRMRIAERAKKEFEEMRPKPPKSTETEIATE